MRRKYEMVKIEIVKVSEDIITASGWAGEIDEPDE